MPRKAILACLLAATAWAGQSNGRKVSNLGCQMSTGVCRAVLDATLASATSTRKCGGSVVKWSMNYSGGAVLTLEIEKAVLNRRYVNLTWDDSNCFDSDPNALALTGITIDLSKAGY